MAKPSAGFALYMVQIGRDPDDWKPMATIGPAIREIRVKDEAGAFRLIYIAKFQEAVYVLLKARADLMAVLADHIKAQGWTQAEAAKHLGVTQPRISDLVRGKFNLFGLDHLAMMLARAGRPVEIRVKKATPRTQAA